MSKLFSMIMPMEQASSISNTMDLKHVHSTQKMYPEHQNFTLGIMKYINQHMEC
jgi:hypothetical protein